MLVGTKSDLKGMPEMRNHPDDEDITKAEGKKLAREINATCYMETSSKTGEGVKELFDETLRAVMKSKKKK